MKNFIYKTVFFLLGFVFLFSTVVILNFYSIKNPKIIIPKTKSVLILGDSNSECAIDDSVFNSSFNLSSSADSYFYSYLKLKNIVSYNKVDTLLLSFSPQNIFDNGWTFNDSHIHLRFKKYYPLMSKNDLFYLFKNKPLAVIRSLFLSTKKNENRLKYGGYLPLKRNVLKESLEKLNKGEKLPFFSIPKNFNPSISEVEYLNRIITICNENNITLYFVNMPKRKEILNYSGYGIPQFNTFYNANYSSIKYLDFSNLNMPDEYYGDFVHLNVKGASFLSELLNQKGIKRLEINYLYN